MRLAAQVLAATAVDLITRPDTIRVAQQELERARGDDFHYEALLGERDPPLDYRN